MDFLLVLGSLKEYAICFSQRAQRRREYQPPAQQVQGAGRGVDESESIAPIQVRVTSVSRIRRERRFRLWKPMHLQPVYKNNPRYVNGVSESLFKQGLCLPSGPCVTDEDVAYIVQEIKNAMKI
mgnify:CR=1 FL=1